MRSEITSTFRHHAQVLRRQQERISQLESEVAEIKSAVTLICFLVTRKNPESNDVLTGFWKAKSATGVCYLASACRDRARVLAIEKLRSEDVEIKAISRDYYETMGAFLERMAE